LKKSVNIPEMRQFRVIAFHATCQHVWDRTLFVKFVTQLSVNSAKDWVCVSAPSIPEVLKFLQLQSSDPFEKPLRHSQFLVYVVYGLFVIKDILVLGISEVSEHILGVAGKSFEHEQVFETQLLHKPIFLFWRNFYLDLLVVVLISVLFVLVVRYLLVV